MRLTIDIPDDLALLVDEYRKGQSPEAWVLDAIERKISLLRDGVVLRRPEEVDVEEELALIASAPVVPFPWLPVVPWFPHRG